MGVWEIAKQEAVRLDVTNARGGRGTHFKANYGEDIWAVLQRQTPWFEPEHLVIFHEMHLEPDLYYPRIARPLYRQHAGKLGWCPSAPKERNRIGIARGQMSALIGQLTRICQTVHLVPTTFKTYGHDVRNLLILVCTEVEAQWRAVLEANGVPPKKRDYNSEDYVNLCPPMRLDEYGIRFQTFRGWSLYIRSAAGGRKADQPNPLIGTLPIMR